MYKLVVLFSVLAVARASGLFAAPLAYHSALIAPATTTISKQFSSVVHPSPLAYTYAAHAPLTYTHFLKKRSVAPFISTYSTYGSPLISTPLINSSPLIYHPSPLIHSTSLYHSSPYAHYLRKRSVSPFLTTYLAPTAYSSQSRFDVHSSPLFTGHTTYAAPLAYSSHLPYSHFY